MKKAIIASLAMLSTSAFADFSTSIIGDETAITDKDFSQRSLESIHRGQNELVLTFDDGPTPGVTDKMLDLLKEKNIKATFFVIADKVKVSPGLTQRIVNEGHIVANHSTSHQNLNELKFYNWKKNVKSEVIDAHYALEKYMQGNRNYFYRAPHGAWSSKYAEFLNKESFAKNYIGPVLWDIGGAVTQKDGRYVEAADWACWSRKMTVDECLEGYMADTKRKKGGIVLFHDLRGLSVELARKFIDSAEASGYTFKNLDEINLSK